MFYKAYHMVTPVGRVYIDELMTVGAIAGHRRICLTIAIYDGDKKTPVEIELSPEDGLLLMRHIQDVNKSAWDFGAPLDAKPNEQRPHWLK